jgi:RNA polymerase sigma-70 factor, ECF subfamily
VDSSLQEHGRRAAENAARTSYGRLLAYLARQWRDLTAAEDALADAFARALDVWPTKGVPANPDAWLMVAARNRLRDGARAGKTRDQIASGLLVLAPTETEDTPVIADKRLELMFVCGHPAIDAAARTPLMLQTVLGLTAERIASSFLVSPDTMGRRLSRAKARIKDTGLWAGLGQHGLRRPDPQGADRRGDLAGAGAGGAAARGRRGAWPSSADAVLRKPQRRAAGG